eukprot:jgi/Botrbrau1/19399/Bobra.0338s0027.1
MGSEMNVYANVDRQSADESSQETEDLGISPGSTAETHSTTIVADLILPKNLPFKHKSGLTHQGKKVFWKRLKHILIAEKDKPPPPSMGPTYMDIVAPKSKYPAKKYCDLTGHEARYVDSKTDLQYAYASQFHIIRTLSKERVEASLALRRAAHVLR